MGVGQGKQFVRLYVGQLTIHVLVSHHASYTDCSEATWTNVQLALDTDFFCGFNCAFFLSVAHEYRNPLYSPDVRSGQSIAETWLLYTRTNLS